MKVKAISIKEFKKKYKIKEVDPWSTGVFSKADIETLRNESGIISVQKKILQLITLIPVFLKNPVRIIKNLKELLKTHTSGVTSYYADKKKLAETSPFSLYTLRASIISAFKPKVFLEIGTGAGWGITAFKSVLKDCLCYTMSPKLTPEIGKVVKAKKLGIKQIWSDSLKYDFSKLKNIDVSYIDGNHNYKWVFSDLVNCNKITKKLIMLDDYIPSKNSRRGEIGQWQTINDDIVKAVDDFLKNYPKAIKKAYWLKNSNLCVLIK